MEFYKKTVKVGNSAGVLLPKNLLGAEVKITVVERPVNIRKDVFKVLAPYLEDILGIYLTGDYAREEEDENSHVEILAISDSISKIFRIGKYNVTILPLAKAEKALKENIVSIHLKIKEAKPILNKFMLKKLHEFKLTKPGLIVYAGKAKKDLALISSLLENSENLNHEEVFKSLISLLKEIFTLKCIMEKKQYFKKNFFEWLSKYLSPETISKIGKERIKVRKKEIDKINIIAHSLLLKQEGLLMK